MGERRRKSRGKYCPGSEDSSETPEPEEEEGKRKVLRWEQGSMVISYRYLTRTAGLIKPQGWPPPSRDVCLDSSDNSSAFQREIGHFFLKSSLSQEFCMASTGK